MTDLDRLLFLDGNCINESQKQEYQSLYEELKKAVKAELMVFEKLYDLIVDTRRNCDACKN